MLVKQIIHTKTRAVNSQVQQKFTERKSQNSKLKFSDFDKSKIIVC